MNATEPILTSTPTNTPTETATEKKPRRRLTLEERIEAAQGRLAAKEAERDQLAKALHSLRASKMNKDRNAQRKARNHTLILLGIWYKKLLFDSPIKLVTTTIETFIGIKKELEEKLIKTEKEKEQKTIKKEIEDKKTILARLIEIKTEKETQTKTQKPNTHEPGEGQPPQP